MPHRAIVAFITELQGRHVVVLTKYSALLARSCPQPLAGPLLAGPAGTSEASGCVILRLKVSAILVLAYGYSVATSYLRVPVSHG